MTRSLPIIILTIPLIAVVLRSAEPARGQVTTVSEAAHNQFVLAYRLLQRGQDGQAVEAFDEYLGNFPRDEKRGDALYYRSLLAMRADRRRMALRLLADAPVPKIVPTYAIPLLVGQLNTDLGAYAEALAVLETIDPETMEPVLRASTLHLRGMAYRGVNNLPAADAKLEAAAAIDSPLRGRALLDRARVLIAMERDDDAMQVLTECLESKDRDVVPDAARLGADLAYREGRHDQAVALYEIILTGYQTSAQFLAAVRGTVWAHFGARRFGQVLVVFKQYRDTISKPQDRLDLWYVAGSAQQELGRHAEAIALFTAVLDDAGAWPTLDKLLYKLASSQFELERYPSMQATLARLKRQRPDSSLNADGSFLLATADARRGQTVQAVARLTAIVDRGREHAYFDQALLHRGKLHEIDGLHAQAIADYETYLARENGRATSIAAEIGVRLIDLHFREGNFEKSVDFAGTLLGPSAKVAPLIEQEALYRGALAQIKLKRYDAAQQMLQRLTSRHPQNKYREEAAYYGALVLIATDEADLALKPLKALAASDTLDQPLRTHALRLAGIHLRQIGSDNEAFQTLTQLETLAGRDTLTIDERHWLGKHLAATGRHESALTYLQPLLDDRDSLARGDRAEVLYLAGLSRRHGSDHDGAIAAFAEVVALGAGFDLRARLELGHTLRRAERLDEAIEAYGGLVNARPTSIAVDALLGRAAAYRMLARHRKLQDDTVGAADALRSAQHTLTRLTTLHDAPQLSPLPQKAHIELHEVLLELGEPAVPAREVQQNLQDLLAKFPNGLHADYAKALLAVLRKNRKDAVFLLKRLNTKALDDDLRKRIEAQLRQLTGDAP